MSARPSAARETDEPHWLIEGAPHLRTPTTSARIAWTNDSDNIEVALWGKNLLDKEIASNPDGFVADTFGAYRTSIEDPLTWGVDLRYSF